MTAVIKNPPHYMELEDLAREFCRVTNQEIEDKQIFDIYAELPITMAAAGISLLLKQRDGSSKLAVITLTHQYFQDENPERGETHYQYTGPLNGEKVSLLTKVIAEYQKGQTIPFREIIKRKDKVPVWFVCDAGVESEA